LVEGGVGSASCAIRCRRRRPFAPRSHFPDSGEKTSFGRAKARSKRQKLPFYQQVELDLTEPAGSGISVRKNAVGSGLAEELHSCAFLIRSFGTVRLRGAATALETGGSGGDRKSERGIKVYHGEAG
jgi:hypothetical protein